MDPYLDGSFPKDLLVEKKNSLEHTIQSLQIEKNNLKELVEKKTISPEQILELQDFSHKILEGLDLVSCDFQAKRKILLLDFCTLRIE